MLIVIVLTDVDVNDHQDAEGNNDSGYYANGVDGENDNNSGDDDNVLVMRRMKEDDCWW